MLYCLKWNTDRLTLRLTIINCILLINNNIDATYVSSSRSGDGRYRPPKSSRRFVVCAMLLTTIFGVLYVKRFFNEKNEDVRTWYVMFCVRRECLCMYLRSCYTDRQTDRRWVTLAMAPGAQLGVRVLAQDRLVTLGIQWLSVSNQQPLRYLLLHGWSMLNTPKLSDVVL